MIKKKFIIQYTDLLFVKNILNNYIKFFMSNILTIFLRIIRISDVNVKFSKVEFFFLCNNIHNQNTYIDLYNRHLIEFQQ